MGYRNNGARYVLRSRSSERNLPKREGVTNEKGGGLLWFQAGCQVKVNEANLLFMLLSANFSSRKHPEQENLPEVSAMAIDGF